VFGEEATEKVLCGSAQCMIGECLVMGQVGHVLGNFSKSGSGGTDPQLDRSGEGSPMAPDFTSPKH